MRLNLKRALITALIMLIGGCSAVWYLASDRLPEADKQVAPDEVERRVDEMWAALNAPAWFSAEGASWTFVGKYHYVWHKRLGRVRVTLSDEVAVYLEPHTGRGFALERGARVTEDDRHAELIAEATSRFNNDSFWLAAPYKIRDPGTQRSLTRDEDGEGLLVYYESGGTTPGDRYLWRLDAQGRPRLWQLWVKIIPVKGVSLTWEDWRQSESGAWISHLHRSPLLDVKLQDVKVTQTFKALGVNDPLLTSSQWDERLR